MDKAKEVFVWKGKSFTNYKDIIDTALKMDKKEQEKFVEELYKLWPMAKGNIGYISGYYNHATADRILSIFGTTHPIFGGGHPTSEEAFKKGVETGKAARKKKA